MMAQKESEDFMKAYARIAKIAMTVMLLAAFFLLSGFRAQTIIHDDGSETQDVLKVSDSAKGQKDLKPMPMNSRSAIIPLWIITTIMAKASGL